MIIAVMAMIVEMVLMVLTFRCQVIIYIKDNWKNGVILYLIQGWCL